MLNTSPQFSDISADDVHTLIYRLNVGNSGIDKLQVPPKMPTLEERLVKLINQAPVMVFIKGISLLFPFISISSPIRLLVAVILYVC